MKRDVSEVSNTFSIFLYAVLGNKMEKEMATHSSVLAWRIPWAEEPGRMQSME